MRAVSVIIYDFGGEADAAAWKVEAEGEYIAGLSVCLQVQHRSDYYKCLCLASSPRTS